MTAGIITARDLRGMRILLDLSDPASRCTSVDDAWATVLSAIRSIVACDAVTLQIQDVAAQLVVAVRQLSDRYELDTRSGGTADELYWRKFWSSHLSHPQRSGDYFTVTTTTDFEPGGRFADTVGATATRTAARGRAARITLPLQGTLDYRVWLWRADGPDFSDDEVVLLSVLRPTLVAIRDKTFPPDATRAELTPRQLQLLGLVATGLTNRQTARQLGVSEHTVRKHIENIFGRLGVASRTAAINRVFAADPLA